MKKPLFSALYFLSLATAGITINQAFAQRSPSVEPMTEVSIEENRPASAQTGFDFQVQNHVTKAVETKRVPANIVSKTSTTSTPYSFIGPLIFLFALPVALWIVVAKKMKNSEASAKVDYYPKTFQFKPYKTDYQSQDVDDDEDYPKAS